MRETNIRIAHRAVRRVLVLGVALVFIMGLAFLTFVCVAAAVLSAVPARGEPDDRNLLSQMVGTWDVQQRMWPGAGRDAIPLPPAVARRRMVGGAFLEEVIGRRPSHALEALVSADYFSGLGDRLTPSPSESQRLSNRIGCARS